MRTNKTTREWFAIFENAMRDLEDTSSLDRPSELDDESTFERSYSTNNLEIGRKGGLKPVSDSFTLHRNVELGGKLSEFSKELWLNAAFRHFLR